MAVSVWRVGRTVGRLMYGRPVKAATYGNGPTNERPTIQYNKLVIFKNLSSMVCTKTIGLDHIKSIYKIQVVNGWLDPCVIMEDKPNKRRQETEEGGKDYQMRRWNSCGQHLAPDKGNRGRERSQIKQGGFSSEDTKLLSCWLQGAASLAELDWQQHDACIQMCSSRGWHACARARWEKETLKLLWWTEMWETWEKKKPIKKKCN